MDRDWSRRRDREPPPVKARFLGIQARTFLAFGTFALLILGGGGWAAARYFEAASQRQIECQQHHLVVVLAEAMDHTIALHRATLEAICRAVPDGMADDGPAARRWLERHRGIRALFEDGIFLVRPDGTILADDMKVPLSPPLQTALRPFFRSVAIRGKAATSEVYRSEHSGGPAFIMATPQLGADGRTRLLLAGSLDLADDNFLGDVASRRIPDASRLSLLDHQGRILLHPDKARLFTRIQPRAWGSFMGERVGGSGIRLDTAGSPVLTSVQHLQALPWTLVASLPLAQARAPIDRLRGYFQAAVALALLGVLGLTWLLSHRLTEGLEAFTADVRAAMNRPAGQRIIPRRGNDEVGLLVDAFNALVARLDNKALRLMRAKEAQDEELALAKEVFQRLVGPGLRALPPHLHMETLQTGRINGDACAYREGIPGLHFGLICDATGHGLTAGISTLPAIQVFLSMARRDIPLETIYAEINRKVHQMMPVERFVCLLLLRLDAHSGTLTVLNAGLPEAILCSPDGRRRSFASRNLPAGILAHPDTPVVETVAVAPGGRLLAITDGVLDVFPAEELDRHLLQGFESRPFEVHRRAIQESLALGIRDREQHDDVSWALWEAPPPAESRLAELASEPAPELVELDEGLTLTLRFAPQRHTVRDVLPNVIQLLSSRGLGAQDEQKLTLVLNEALANAVDHGVLRLDSRLKEQGFEVYEALRNLHLSALQGGSVKLTLRLRTLPSGPLREIDVEVEDTGPGFDWRAWEQGLDEATLAPSGRGLLLIRALSTGLAFNEAGNRIRFTLPCG